ncbi:hypothetical protein E9993_04185 [Labilibacter sediminis]|nr:hypothetical protein E9993_04185 [Labilibacter sediminis]
MKPLFLLFLLFPSIIYGQIKENWDDDNFSSPLLWHGTLTKFTVDKELKLLKLNAPSTKSDAYICTPSPLINNATWSFSVNMEFNPSSTNYAKIFLNANQKEFNEKLEGYYVMIGGTTDEISLWKQHGGHNVKIIDGTDDSVGLSSVAAVITVERNELGNWILKRNINQTETIVEGEAFDNQLFSSNYFGIYCKYTSTRSNKFSFGPIHISGTPFEDNEAPHVLNHEVVSDNQVSISFNESIQTSKNPEVNFTLLPQDINPDKVSLSNENIDLFFENTFPDDYSGLLQIIGIKDNYGNKIKDTTLNISYHKPERFDIVFSELMIDPIPSMGLPEAEYIEIFNRNDYSINIENWELTINDKNVLLPAYDIDPKSYLIITHHNSMVEWPEEPNIIGINGLPALINSSGTLILRNADLQVCDVVQYPFYTANNNHKSDGGWSLERIDCNNLQSNNNWNYSENLTSGTPGKLNSITSVNPDLEPPFVKHVSYISENTFTYTFSESIDTTGFLNNKNVNIENVEVREINVDSIFLDKISLTFYENLNPNTIYHTNFEFTPKDFAGNALANKHSLKIGIPEPTDSFNICINELLFNPNPEEYDFVELYNRSNKILNKSEFYLSSVTYGVPEKLFPIDNKNQLLFPGEYMVISEDTNWFRNKNIVTEQLLMAKLPSLNDDAGNIAITKINGEIIDYLEYTDDMHFELLRSTEGVSLERINPNAPTNNNNNWHSASSASKYSTPGQKNSQFSALAIHENTEWVWLEDEEFSPNSDGYSDFLQINYQLPEPGWSATLQVYDRYGRTVKTICNNDLLSTSGFYIWDGTTYNNAKAEIGIYLVFIESFSPKGEIKKEKLVAVLSAGRK